MATVLVTGGAGFIGSHLVTRLVADGHMVRVLDDLSTGSMSNLSHLPEGAFDMFRGACSTADARETRSTGTCATTRSTTSCTRRRYRRSRAA